MMSFTWRSRNAANHSSIRWQESQRMPDVSFAVRRVSLENRLELVKRVRDLCLQYEFLRAGDNVDQSEAAMSDLLVKKLYLEWGLVGIRGLSIDGKAATVESLIASGPEELAEEVIEHIRHELGLTEEERKNS